jgi:S-DNA-T family DNA segregation ATPase FtsK/SpoIIIE
MATATRKKSAKRRPAAKTRPKTGSGKQGSARAKRPAGGGRTAATRAVGRAPVNENQQRRDAIGLLLLAAATFFACVLYLGWQGGKLGEGATAAFTFLIGQATYLAPVALALGGIAAIMRPVMPPLAFRWPAAVVLTAGILLALAAGTFGLGEAKPKVHDLFDSAYFEGHGGVIGEVLYAFVSTLLQSFGAHVVAVALVLIGLQQLSGSSLVSIGGTLSRLGRGVGRRPVNDHAQSRAAREFKSSKPVEEVVPPEPPGVEPIVRATHVEAPALDDAIEPEPADDPSPEQEPDATDETDVKFIAPDEESDDAELALDPGPEPGETDVVQAGASRQFAKVGADLAAITEASDIPYKLPKPKALRRSSEKERVRDTGQEKIGRQLIESLGHFGVDADLIGTVSGPHVTRYELKLAPGTKMNKVAQLKDDLAYALASTDIRILAPIPGKQAVGVEVPNLTRRIVRLGDIFQPHPADYSPLSVWLGKDIAGKAIGTDIAKMPHLLVAGTTGAGKSGAINSMLCSILLRATPNDARLVLIDPKQVELNLYEQIPHLLTPVVTSPRMAANVLANLIREMEQRYTLMSAYKVRNIKELNDRRRTEGERPLPFILCVIDELADLMMVAPAEVEDAIIRLAQKSRAVGMHLLLATQRPSADIITGMIKANVPSRIAFAVSSQTDSRVILDQNGAESLLGQGDMLFSPIGSSKLQRIQGAFVTEEEIAQITDFWRKQGEPEFHEELLEETESGDEDRDGLDPDADELLPEAIRLVVDMGTASTSMLQRRLRVGYTRAGRLIDMMERRGVISGYEGSKARQVLITEADVARIIAHLAEEPGTQPELPPASALNTSEDTLERDAIDGSSV